MQAAQKSPTDSADTSPRQFLSEWLDGERTLGDSFNLTNVNRDKWDTYHLIGDVMRRSDLATQPSAAFQARLNRALDAELPIIASPRRTIQNPWRLGPVWRGRCRCRGYRGLGVVALFRRVV